MKTDQSCVRAKTGPANPHQGAHLPRIRWREHPCTPFRAHLPRYGHTSPKTVYIVRQVPDPDFDFSMNRTDCSQNKVPGHLSLNTEHMFDPAPYTRSRPVTPFLPISQRPVPAPLPLKVFPIPAPLQFSQCILRTVRRIRPHAPVRIRLVEQVTEHHAVMHRHVRHYIVPDELVFDIHTDVVLVPKCMPMGSRRPPRMDIFLPTLRLAPFSGHITFLDLSVLLTTVPLNGYRHNRRVHNLSLPRRESLIPEISVEPFKKALHHARAPQLLTEQPYRLGVRHPVADGKSPKPHERQPVTNLVLHRIVAQIVQRLEYQHLEHQHHIERLPARRAFPFLFPDGLQFRAKHLPVHTLVKTYQRIAVLCQISHLEFNVEQSLYHCSSPSLSIVYTLFNNIPFMKGNAIKICTLNRNF